MRVKMVDVARYLGVSKATVSLAVNNKPGVNEQTRQKILNCIKEMEKAEDVFSMMRTMQGKEESKNPEGVGNAEYLKNSEYLRASGYSGHTDYSERNLMQNQPESAQKGYDAEEKKMIKVVIINHQKQVVCDPELDLWSEVLKTFDAEARRLGYLYGLAYMNDEKREVEELIQECNLDMVAGVIVFGTEITKEDFKKVEEIKKPIVLYDCEASNGEYTSVCIDNKGAVKQALELLWDAGAKDIRYICTDKDIYNFRKRREAFQDILVKWEHMPKKSDIVPLGNTISEISEKAQEWLKTEKLPEAFLFENYQVSIGMLAALRKLGVHVPQDVKLIGIDEVPEYMTSGLALTQLKIPHAQRATMAMELLHKEILCSWDTKIKLFAEAKLITQNSI